MFSWNTPSFWHPCCVWYQTRWFGCSMSWYIKPFFPFDISLERLAGLLNDNSIISNIMWDLFGGKTEAESGGNVMCLSVWAARHSSGDLSGLCVLALPMQIRLETFSRLLHSCLYFCQRSVSSLFIDLMLIRAVAVFSIWCLKDSFKAASDSVLWCEEATPPLVRLTDVQAPPLRLKPSTTFTRSPHPLHWDS